MPGPFVHFRLTMDTAISLGYSQAEAEAIARGDVGVDLRTPGHKYWWLHFNPTASLIFAPREIRTAKRAQAAGNRAEALEHLGRALHMYQDSVGHGRIGLNHLLYDAKLFRRHPDDWETMPPGIQRRIKRVTYEALRKLPPTMPPETAAAKTVDVQQETKAVASPEIGAFLDRFVHWARGREDIRAVGLAGSHARGEARVDSDVDIIALVDDPAAYVTETDWTQEFGKPASIGIEEYGRLTSVRVRYIDGPEVEFGFSTPQWASEPLDPGTEAVVRKGFAVLWEREPLLSVAVRGVSEDTVRP